MLLLPAARRLPLTLVLLAAATSACGPGKLQTSRDERVIRQLPADDAFAEDYFVDDLPCQQGDGAATLGTAQFHQWQGDSSRSVRAPIAGATSTASLASPGIASTYFGFRQVQTCTRNGSALECPSSSKVTSAPAPLKICNTGKAFPRASVEGVALASLANLEAAHAYYDKIPGRSTTMRRASLLVLPTIEKTYDDVDGGRKVTKRQVMTDNLAYAPSFGGEPLFVVFPKGRRAVRDGLWSGLNLWELPWGLAHEYGHHVFRTHTGITSLESTGLDLDGIRTIHSFDMTARAGSASTWNAVNEAYADLFAHYSFGSKAGLMARVDCFETSRDLASDKFADGTPKILTGEILDTFASGESGTTVKCTTPSFHDEHAIGAIIAFGVERLFALGADGADDPSLVKSQWLLAWAGRLGQLAKSAGGPTGVALQDLVKEALLVAQEARPSKKLSDEQCDVVRQRFPAYAEAWMARGVSCE